MAIILRYFSDEIFTLGEQEFQQPYFMVVKWQKHFPNHPSFCKHLHPWLNDEARARQPFATKMLLLGGHSV